MVMLPTSVIGEILVSGMGYARVTVSARAVTMKLWLHQKLPAGWGPTMGVSTYQTGLHRRGHDSCNVGAELMVMNDHLYGSLQCLHRGGGRELGNCLHLQQHRANIVCGDFMAEKFHPGDRKGTLVETNDKVLSVGVGGP